MIINHNHSTITMNQNHQSRSSDMIINYNHQQSMVSLVVVKRLLHSFTRVYSLIALFKFCKSILSNIFILLHPNAQVVGSLDSYPMNYSTSIRVQKNRMVSFILSKLSSIESVAKIMKIGYFNSII